jgi:thiamine-phosphate pyrophosphorylase
LLEQGGADVALHVRGHGITTRTLLGAAADLVPAARAAGALLLVNDRIDVALAADAPGVQLGSRSVPLARVRQLLRNRLIGFSAHSAEEALKARQDGTDFVLLGTIYPSASHPERRPLGASVLSDVVARVNVPVIAIGGMSAERTTVAMAQGAYGVAAIASIWDAQEPTHAVGEYIERIMAADRV